jgi:type IV pilus assembly protein PilE
MLTIPKLACAHPTSGAPQATDGIGRAGSHRQNPTAMESLLHPTHRRKTSAGFTLVELMITILVLGILAAVAYPSFLDAVRKSRRSDGIAALSAVQQAQERWRGNNVTYADNSQLTLAPTANPPGLGLSATSSSGYYNIAITATGAANYTLTATAVSGKTQGDDGNCKFLGIDAAGGVITYGSGATGVNFPDAHNCWAR